MNGIKEAVENHVKRNKFHFIFAGNAYWLDITLRPVIVEGMKKYSINSAMISILSSVRSHVIEKEEVENHCKGKTKTIHDDLDSFFERLCRGEEREETVRTNFLPMLSETEMELFEANDADFMRTLRNPERHHDEFDLPTIELADSRPLETNDDKSKLKYIRGICFRQTFLIHNDKN